MTVPWGQLVPLEIAVRDSTGALADAGQVRLEVTRPGDTLDVLTVAHPSTGVYRYDYVPAEAGVHTVRWVVSGTNACAPPLDVFEVRPATTDAVVSLSDLRKHLSWPDTPTSQDADLLEIAEQATATLRGSLGRPLRRAVYTDVVPAPRSTRWADVAVCGMRRWSLAMVPCVCAACRPHRVLEVLSVTVGGVPLTASTSRQDPAGGYAVDPATGVVLLDVLAGDATITYAAGYSTLPGWLPLAVKRLTEHLWTRSQQARHVRGTTEPSEARPATADLLPYMVESLIADHRAGGL